jgi:hypothetical protein
MSVIAFHEKAGRSQVGLLVLLVKVSLFGRVATDAMLPYALFDERSLADERFIRSVQVGRSRFSRCCHLFVALGSIWSIEVGPGD